MRKLVVGSLALGLATLGWGAASFGQKVPVPRGEIRIVDKNPSNWAWVTLNVMEHLMEVDNATNGNGVIIPALVPATDFGYDPTLAPNPFDPARARELLREAVHPDGLTLTLIAQEDLKPQVTVVGKMLEQVGLKPQVQVLDPVTYNRKTILPFLDQPAESQTWDIALGFHYETLTFPVYHLYHNLALDGQYAWVAEAPELRRLYEAVLRTVDREKQQALIRQMERHARDQAYFLFLYNPIQLYAVNKAVKFVPYVNTSLTLVETSVTDQHWSVRKGAAGQ